jgi:Fur family ferric uptake transcriptional regulator
MASSPSTRPVPAARAAQAPAVAQRGTRQKAAIRSVIDGSARPLLPQEILEAAQQEVAALSIATVYRNLKLLAEAEEIRAVELPGEAPRYESARHGHHHHFQCRTCARVFDVHACPGNFSALAPKGFRVDAHELTLYGQCADCRQAAKKSGR